jgi:hypothetical protein
VVWSRRSKKKSSNGGSNLLILELLRPMIDPAESAL